MKSQGDYARAISYSIQLSLVLCLIVSLEAAPRQKLHFTNLGTEQGLSNGAVQAILQDSEGFMWFGTQRGLNRWDGRNFRVFSYQAFDSTSLPSSRITTLAETEDKMLWVGTYDAGLARFNPQTESFHSYHPISNDPNSLPDENITALFIDSRDELWVGTENGLCRYDPQNDHFKRYVNHPEDDRSIPDNWIAAITEDADGTIWIGSNTSRLSAYRQESDNFTTVKHKRFKSDGAGTNRITSLTADSMRQVIWVSMFPQGIFSYHPGSGRVDDYGMNTQDEHMVNINIVFDVDLAEDGKLWIGSLNGLTVLNPESLTYEFHEPDPTDSKSISGALIFEIYRDPQGIIWTGSDGHGVDIHNPNQIRFEHYQSIASGGNLLQASKVFGLDTDASGNIWAATFAGGFHRLDLRNHTVRLFQTDDTNPNVWSMNYGNKVLVDMQNWVWMSSFEAGLFRWDPYTNTIRHFRHLPGRSGDLSGNDIYAIYEDRSGTIWVGTKGDGLNRYQPEDESFVRYRHDPLDSLSICSDNINVMLEDHRGDLWIGTPDAGLDRLVARTEGFQHHTVRTDGNSIRSNTVHTLFEDSHHCLWIGTRGGGISRLDSNRTTFTQIDLGADSQPFSVDAILEDNQGTFWASSNRGILKIHHDLGLQNTYTVSDGVQGLDFYWNSVTKDADGYFYFGGVNGFNRFNPDSIRNNSHLPPVRITNLRINHEDVPIGPQADGRIVLPRSITYMDTLLLTYRDKVLNFSFAALDYSNPGLNRYRYKLDGFDPDWIDAGHVNSVTYTSLNPGWYTLRIAGSNNDGIWNEEGSSLTLFIQPPFWETIWFRSLGILILALVISGIYQIRIKKLKLLEQRNAEKQKVQLQLEHQQRELVTKSMDLIEKQKFMEDLLDQLKILKKSSSSERDTQTLTLIKRLTSLVSINHVWDEFEKWFTKIHTGYIKSLRTEHPSLTSSEIKVCAFLRLNLTSKEIASLLNIEPASVDIHRYRIRKKCGLGQDENLTKYLSKY